MKKNIVKEKSFGFAVRVVKLYQFLCDTKKGFVMSKQLLRSGTAVGALVREAEHAESKKDFGHKMAIAQKECNETIYWLELLKETDYLKLQEFDSVNKDAIEIIKRLISIIKKTKSNIKTNN